MASATSFLVLTVAALALVHSIEAWLPYFFQGFNPGYNPEYYIPEFNPGYNPYIPPLPFVPGFPAFSGAPPLYYDDNHVMEACDGSSAGSPSKPSEHSESRSHLQDSTFFDSPFSGALSPFNWLFRKWPISWNVPPATTHYYNTEDGNGWAKVKTWSWSF